MLFNKISVIGLGYIGLPTAAVFASRRVNVIGVDVSQSIVDTVNACKIHIVEPELDIVVHATVTEGFLRASTIPEPADAFLIAVPTPFKTGQEPDLSYIESAVQAIAPVLKSGNLVVLESTSPVGTTEQIAEWLLKARPDLTFPQTHGEDSDIRIAYCPERVLPGHVIRELVENDRVIGGMTSKCSEVAVELYQICVEGQCIITHARTAEMCKLTENSFRDVNIAFANELSMICDQLEINPWELIQLANRHPRVNILQPGAGVGGHCIAVDPWFIVHKTPDESKLIRQAREVNDRKPEWVIEKIHQEVDHLVSIGKNESSITVALLGITFKPNIDDLRESPALYISESVMRTSKTSVVIVEPNIEVLPDSFENTQKVELDDALGIADVIIVLVAHDQFKQVVPRLKETQRYFSAVSI